MSIQLDRSLIGQRPQLPTTLPKSISLERIVVMLFKVIESETKQLIEILKKHSKALTNENEQLMEDVDNLLASPGSQDVLEILRTETVLDNLGYHPLAYYLRGREILHNKYPNLELEQSTEVAKATSKRLLLMLVTEKLTPEGLERLDFGVISEEIHRELENVLGRLEKLEVDDLKAEEYDDFVIDQTKRFMQLNANESTLVNGR